MPPPCDCPAPPMVQRPPTVLLTASSSSAMSSSSSKAGGAGARGRETTGGVRHHPAGHSRLGPAEGASTEVQSAAHPSSASDGTSGRAGGDCLWSEGGEGSHPPGCEAPDPERTAPLTRGEDPVVIRCWAIVMEFAEGGTLYDRWENLRAVHCTTGGKTCRQCCPPHTHTGGSSG